MRLESDVLGRHVFHDGTKRENVVRSLARMSKVRPKGKHCEVRSRRGMLSATGAGRHERADMSETRTTRSRSASRRES